MRRPIEQRVLKVLAAAPDGLSAPELRRRLGSKLSQPTLWRLLDTLRSRGALTVEGRARATRYHASTRTASSTLRRLRLHESVASRLAADPDLRDEARERLKQLRHVNPQGRVYHDRWAHLLDGPVSRLLHAMTEDSEAADDLRKESPFTILVDRADRARAFGRYAAPVKYEPRYMVREPMHVVQIQGFQRMTPEAKLRMVADLYRTGVQLKAAGLRMTHPDWTDARLLHEARLSLLRAGT